MQDSLDAQPASPGAAEHSRPADARRRILVIDDEQLIADSLARILNLNGFHARSAYSGDAALDMLHTHCPDIVLTDVRMPGMDGIQTGLIIRQRCPEIRVVLFSGQAAVGDVLQEVRERSAEFELWPKPLPPRELVNRLRQL